MTSSQNYMYRESINQTGRNKNIFIQSHMGYLSKDKKNIDNKEAQLNREEKTH